LTNARVAIEVRMRGEPVPSEVLVHPAELVPIVGQHQHEFDAHSSRFGQRVVEPAEAGRAVIEDRVLPDGIPALEPKSAFRAVAVDTTHAAVQRAAVDEGPSSHDSDAHRARAFEHVVDHRPRRIGEVVVVRAREAQRLPFQFEVRAWMTAEVEADGCVAAGTASARAARKQREPRLPVRGSFQRAAPCFAFARRPRPQPNMNTTHAARAQARYPENAGKGPAAGQMSSGRTGSAMHKLSPCGSPKAGLDASPNSASKSPLASHNKPAVADTAAVSTAHSVANTPSCDTAP